MIAELIRALGGMVGLDMGQMSAIIFSGSGVIVGLIFWRFFL